MTRADRLATLLQTFIATPHLHAKWLNTLSYLENCGARKIASIEHPQNVSKEMLKHAAEEFRHAFYLKQQITTKLGLTLPSYRKEVLFGGQKTLRYLDRLELHVCRYLKKQKTRIPIATLKQHAYLLVTYAIELRASALYPLYQQLLIDAKSPVSVRSILLEEKGHLEEMERELTKLYPDKKEIMPILRTIEHNLFDQWLIALVKE